MVVRGYQSQVRAKHAEDTRRSIVEAAAALFAERGRASPRSRPPRESP
jgi:AcrR family transcriptional regulator